MKMKNVVFDVGNVLLRFDTRAILEALFDDEQTRSALGETVFRSTQWLAMDRGVLDFEEAIRQMTAAQPRYVGEIRHLMEGWTAHVAPIPESVAQVRRLKASGCGLYILSNYAAYSIEYARRQFEFFDLFDGVMVSCYEGLLKPELALFRRMQHDFSLNPAETLFIDDQVANIEAAQHLGFQTLLFRDAGQLRRILD